MYIWISFAVEYLWENIVVNDQNANLYLFWVDNYYIRSIYDSDWKFAVYKWSQYFWSCAWPSTRKTTIIVMSWNTPILFAWLSNKSDILPILNYKADYCRYITNTQWGFRMCVSEDDRLKICSIDNDNDCYYIDDASDTSIASDDVCISNLAIDGRHFVFWRDGKKLIKFWYNILTVTKDWVKAFWNFDEFLWDFGWHFRQKDWKRYFSTQIASYNITDNQIIDKYFLYWDKKLNIIDLEMESWFVNDVYRFWSYIDNQIIWVYITWNKHKLGERYYLLNINDYSDNNNNDNNNNDNNNNDNNNNDNDDQQCVINNLWLIFWDLQNYFYDLEIGWDTNADIRTKKINWTSDESWITNGDFYNSYLKPIYWNLENYTIKFASSWDIYFGIVWDVNTHSRIYKYFWKYMLAKNWFFYDWMIWRKGPVYIDENKEVRVGLWCSWNTVYWRDIDNNIPLCKFGWIENGWYWRDKFNKNIVYWYFEISCGNWLIKFFDSISFYTGDESNIINENINWLFTCDRDWDGEVWLVEATICWFTIAYKIFTQSYKLVDNFKDLMSKIAILKNSCSVEKINFLTGWNLKNWWKLIYNLSKSSEIINKNLYIERIKTAIYVLLFIISTILIWWGL